MSPWIVVAHNVSGAIFRTFATIQTRYIVVNDCAIRATAGTRHLFDKDIHRVFLNALIAALDLRLNFREKTPLPGFIALVS
jgi:hypothetical protein